MSLWTLQKIFFEHIQDVCFLYAFSFFCGLNMTTFHSIAFRLLFFDAHLKKKVFLVITISSFADIQT